MNELEERLGHQFERPELLQQALTHRSFAFERDGVRDGERHYERLELLGDAVLGLVASQWLFATYPAAEEGQLSKLKAHLVSEPVLATIARDLDLGPQLRLGVGEERSGGRNKDSLLADVLEAILGALYLEAGLGRPAALLEPYLAHESARPSALAGSDAKTSLQEHAQAAGWDLPVYLVTDAVGPDHRKTFLVQVLVRNELVGIGEGLSKKKAEQAAARAALDRLAARRGLS